jgi:hypothetical protein
MEFVRCRPRPDVRMKSGPRPDVRMRLGWSAAVAKLHFRPSRWPEVHTVKRNSFSIKNGTTQKNKILSHIKNNTKLDFKSVSIMSK